MKDLQTNNVFVQKKKNTVLIHILFKV